MKSCRNCGIEYPNRYYECPTWGEELVQVEEKRESHVSGSEHDYTNANQKTMPKSGIVQENQKEQVR